MVLLIPALLVLFQSVHAHYQAVGREVAPGTPRLIKAWWHAIAAHPFAYLSHRATFMWQFLARSNLVLPVWDWLDPASGYGRSPYFTPLVALHDMLQPTLLFRPGLWLALAVAAAAFA